MLSRFERCDGRLLFLFSNYPKAHGNTPGNIHGVSHDPRSAILMEHYVCSSALALTTPREMESKRLGFFSVWASRGLPCFPLSSPKSRAPLYLRRNSPIIFARNNAFLRNTWGSGTTGRYRQTKARVISQLHEARLRRCEKSELPPRIPGTGHPPRNCPLHPPKPS